MRYIQLTEELKQQAVEEFMNRLTAERFSDNKINFSFDLNSKENTDKITLNVRPEAWLKMWSLVSSESGEIGWHGLITRHDNNVFELTDILMYPQYVTGTTVQTDDVEYGNWLMKDLSDEQINTMRFHGHSHVNMSTSPSGVDTNWYNDILQGLMPDDFYIFMILNKREDYFIEIYDLATNTIYEKKDIDINVLLENDISLQDWIKSEKANNIKQKPVTPRLDRIPSYDNIKHYDSVYDAEESFRDLLLSLTAADLKDEPLRHGIMQELTKKAPYTGYFGEGYLKWEAMSDADKIDTAQDYYLFKAPNNSSKKKKTKSKTKKYDYNSFDYWGGLYD